MSLISNSRRRGKNAFCLNRKRGMMGGKGQIALSPIQKQKMKAAEISSSH